MLIPKEQGILTFEFLVLNVFLPLGVYRFYVKMPLDGCSIHGIPNKCACKVTNCKLYNHVLATFEVNHIPMNFLE